MNKLALALFTCCIICIAGCCRKADPEPESRYVADGITNTAADETDSDDCQSQEEQDYLEYTILDSTEDYGLDCHQLPHLSSETRHVYTCRTAEGESLTLMVTRPEPMSCPPPNRKDRDKRGAIEL